MFNSVFVIAEFMIKNWIPTLIFTAGLGSGIYHGIFNKEIYHSRESGHTRIHEKIHAFWIHVVSGVVGSVCLYFLYLKYFTPSVNDFRIEFTDFGLFLLGITGIVGLLPMGLWFVVLSIGQLQHLLKNYIDR